jgi:UDP-N-acetylmuramate dehydrogenase
LARTAPEAYAPGRAVAALAGTHSAFDGDPPLRGVLRCNEPMARYTAFGVGGPAARFYRPADLADLSRFLQQIPATEPLLWLGFGSNLLVRDGGFAGTVVQLRGTLDGMAVLQPGAVRAEAGLACNKLARLCARHGLAGVEFLAGIPGTVGGALAMNAGAFGQEIWSLVRRVETLDRAGVRRVRATSAYQIGYRQVCGPAGEWFVAADLELASGERQQIAARMRALLHRRDTSQPTRWRSCGSVFRNPPGDYAARLIDASGLKGLRIGGAVVSEKHANFILNDRRARASDIEALVEHMRQGVWARFGVSLVPEVRIVGEALDAGRTK